MEKSESTQATGQKVSCSGVKRSALQMYIRNRRLLKRSAEVDSAPAEEWPTPSNHRDSKVGNHLANEQPMLKPVATAKVNQPTTPTTESNKDQTTSLDQDRGKVHPLRQQVSPTGCESQVRTRSGRLVKPPNRYTDFVALMV